jgi:hypothetical protein
MDRLLWPNWARMRSAQIQDEDELAELRDQSELSRRDLISAARREVVPTRKTVDDVPVARVRLAEIVVQRGFDLGGLVVMISAS